MPRTESPPDNQSLLLIDKVKQRHSEIQQVDPATSELLAAVISHLQRICRVNSEGQPVSPLRVRTMRELQPALKALREQCIQEAAAAALGASAARWLSDPETEAGTSRLEISKESRAQLVRLRDALSNKRGNSQRTRNR